MFVSWYSRAYFIISVDKMIHGTRVSSWRDVESCFIDGLACFYGHGYVTSESKFIYNFYDQTNLKHLHSDTNHQ